MHAVLNQVAVDIASVLTELVINNYIQLPAPKTMIFQAQKSSLEPPTTTLSKMILPCSKARNFQLQKSQLGGSERLFSKKLDSIKFVGLSIDFASEKWLQIYWLTLANLVPKKRARPNKHCTPHG
jgi:hypothetical protein